MGDFLKHWLGRLFAVQGLGWGLVISLAFALFGALGIGSIVFWRGLRDALSDFLTSHLQVWHFLFAVSAAATVGIIAAWRVRRTTSEEEVGTGGTVPYPQEVNHFGVIWPIRTVIVGGSTPEFHADMPACLKDRSPLGMAVEDEEGGENILVPLDDLPWKEFVSDRMRFGCFSDGAIYDLTHHGCGMATALKIVEGKAKGIYRSTLARVRGLDKAE